MAESEAEAVKMEKPGTGAYQREETPCHGFITNKI